MQAAPGRILRHRQRGLLVSQPEVHAQRWVNLPRHPASRAARNSQTSRLATVAMLAHAPVITVPVLAAAQMLVSPRAPVAERSCSTARTCNSPSPETIFAAPHPLVARRVTAGPCFPVRAYLLPVARACRCPNAKDRDANTRGSRTTPTGRQPSPRRSGGSELANNLRDVPAALAMKMWLSL